MSKTTTSMEKLRKADWDGLERDVVLRIRLLRNMTASIDDGLIEDKVANDLILPNLRLLAMFCEAIEVSEGEPGDCTPPDWYEADGDYDDD